jgi:hypothetical protein
VVPPMPHNFPCVCDVEWKACGREVLESGRE